MVLQQIFTAALLSLLSFCTFAETGAAAPATTPDAGSTKSPTPFIAHYKGRANGLAVNDLGVRELTDLGNGRYRLEYRAEAMIYSLEETSVFEISDGQILPVSYRSNRGTFFKRRKASLDFDWQQMQVRFTHKNDEGTFALKPGAQDPLSGSMLLTSLLDPAKPEIEYLEADKKKLDVNRLELIDQPVLKTELGDIPTWHLKRVHDNDKRKTEIWLHRDHPAIPVKVHQLDDGDEFQLELVRFEMK